MTGPIEVVLWVATAALDTNFTAKLIDVYPPNQWYPLGYALNLTDTILRLRYCNGRDRAELAKPSELTTSVRHPDASLSSRDMFDLPGTSTRAG